MQLQPIVYVAQMDRSIEWFNRLLDATPAMASEHWTSYEVNGGHLALHLTDDEAKRGSVELSLVAEAPLEAVAARVGHEQEIIEQPFGRSFTVTDPDGTPIQVNEHG